MKVGSFRVFPVDAGVSQQRLKSIRLKIGLGLAPERLQVKAAARIDWKNRVWVWKWFAFTPLCNQQIMHTKSVINEKSCPDKRCGTLDSVFAVVTIHWPCPSPYAKARN